MPNTIPPIVDGRSLTVYKNLIMSALATADSPSFRVLMTFKLLPGMTARTVLDCHEAGAVAGKYYPSGATTNSADGPRSEEEVADAITEMERLGMILSIHGETPDAPSFEREKAFLPTLERIMNRWPKLKIVLEHLSTKAALDCVLAAPDTLAATITAHHLLFTIDDMLGEGLNPHLFCKPVIKSIEDRAALRAAVFGGTPKIFFGSDSAPHSRSSKERWRAPGGVYSSPTAIPALVGLFESESCLSRLPGFLSLFGAAFYGIESPQERLFLKKTPWKVQEEIDGSVPMCAGMKLEWQVVGREFNHSLQ
jgi:dihydroorotase